MKIALPLLSVLLPCVCFAATITSRQGPTVVNGQITESYQGRCDNGASWQLTFSSSQGWQYQGPNGSGALYSTPEPTYEAMKMCGELDTNGS